MTPLNPDIRPLPWTPERLWAATGGTLICGSESPAFLTVSIDSRQIDAQDLFVAIKGTNHDGHAFVDQVLERGVRGFVLSQAQNEAIEAVRKKDATCIVVDDTTRALGAMASFQRQESGVKLVAITGSNGKTSTRAMTAAVLGQGFPTLSTRGNFNNEIGVPLTLLRLSGGYRWAAVEMGMNAPGEIARLAAIAKPDMGIVTNVAAAHLEGLGSIENVAKAKAELLDALEPEQQALLNRDNPLFDTLEKHCRCKVYTFGSKKDAWIRASDVQSIEGRVTFTLTVEGQSLSVTLNTPGRFMVANALAAAGTGILAGLSLDTVKQGLERFEPVGGRMVVITSPRGFHMIDDTYNANPQSMKAAIDTLCDLKGSGRGILVCADMRELGNETDALHREVGRYAAEKGVDKLYGFGDKAGLIIESAANSGLNEDSVFTGSKNDILNALKGALKAGDWVVVKGSRSMAMEDISNELKVLNGA